MAAANTMFSRSQNESLISSINKISKKRCIIKYNDVDNNADADEEGEHGGGKEHRQRQEKRRGI